MSNSPLRAIMVAVDYSDLLALSLPYNLRHFDQLWVVTDGRSAPSVFDVARPFCDRVGVHVTGAFYEGGAAFNNWKALEQGLDAMGRQGWLAILDADVLWPASVCVRSDGADLLYEGPGWSFRQRPGQLCSPLRRMAPWPLSPVPPESEWGRYPVHRNVNEWAGYSQAFHASDPALGPPPWHQTDWKHAGGADSFFQQRWQPIDKVRPPFEVLHLGEAGANWCGRATPYGDGTMPKEAVSRVEEMGRIWQGRRGKGGMDRFVHERL